MRKTFFTLIMAGVILISYISYAQESADMTPERAFYRANLYYEAGNYTGAIEKDESILDKGLKSGNLYYNLGNAYFKNGELGKAILNYERARRLMPRDSDLLSNYRHAKSLMKRPDPPSKRFLAFKWLDQGMAYLTLKQSMMLGFILYYLLVVYMITTKVFKRYARYSTLITYVLCILLALVIIPTAQKIKDLNQGAIITAKIIDARFEPLKDAAVHFPIYEGMKVYILRTKGDWCKIKRPDGKIGWLPKTALGTIGV
jgi:tetratricopeptide (TPR) repeat protein